MSPDLAEKQKADRAAELRAYWMKSRHASPSAPVIAALDDTLCKKTGRHIPGVSIPLAAETLATLAA